VAKVDQSFDRLEVELITPTKSVEVRRGDVVNAGLQIVHLPARSSCHGDPEPLLQRLVCANGMVRRGVRKRGAAGRAGCRWGRKTAKNSNSIRFGN